jgi:magnesium chelatase subunit I
MSLPRTLGELRRSAFSGERLRTRRVKDELRENLMARLRGNDDASIFPGIVGYDDTVVPQIVNAILSRHNFILLGLRGQAKSRILRALTTLLDAQMPYIAGCEIRDNPYDPICRRCREAVCRSRRRDAHRLSDSRSALCGEAGHAGRDHRRPDRRYRPHQSGARRTRTLERVHGSLRPAAARQSRHLRHQRTSRPRRQNSGRPVQHHAGRRCADQRLPGAPAARYCLVFSANPEDYTARGKIITPLKDRIGSEIRTHYPATVDEGIAITAQEAWTRRNGHAMHLPIYIQQVIERIAFAAREDKKIDKRSGVSQRLPISAMENVISNAERRAIRNDEKLVVPRVSDVYAALPAITGKLELEYEGEMKGADHVSRELIRAAIAKTYDEYFTGATMCNRSCSGSTWAARFSCRIPSRRSKH